MKDKKTVHEWLQVRLKNASMGPPLSEEAKERLRLNEIDRANGVMGYTLDEFKEKLAKGGFNPK